MVGLEIRTVQLKELRKLVEGLRGRIEQARRNNLIARAIRVAKTFGQRSGQTSNIYDLTVETANYVLSITYGEYDTPLIDGQNSMYLRISAGCTLVFSVEEREIAHDIEEVLALGEGSFGRKLLCATYYPGGWEKVLSVSRIKALAARGKVNHKVNLNGQQFNSELAHRFGLPIW